MNRLISVTLASMAFPAIANAASSASHVAQLPVPATVLAVRHDGGYYTAGSKAAGQGHSRIVVASYLSNGRLDRTFGTGGRVVSDPGPLINTASQIVIAADGKIVVGGNANFDGSSARGGNLLVERFNENGTPDTTFGRNGIVTTNLCLPCDLNDNVTGLAVQPDGKVIVSAYSIRSSSVQFAVVRYTTTGALDTTFGKGGIVDTAKDGAYSIALQPDGKILAGGNLRGNVELLRYMPNGQLDTTFGIGGQVVKPFENPPTGELQGSAISINLLSDGRLVVGTPYIRTTFTYQWAALRFLADGKVDTSFGTNGLALAPVSTPQTLPQKTLLLPDGRLLIAGDYNFSNPIDPSLKERVFVVRLGTDGKLDTSFAANGTLLTDLQPSVANNSVSVGSIALLPNGNAISTVSSYNPNNGVATQFVLNYR